MRDPKRINKCLRKIKEVWSKHPDLRLGQLIVNAVPEIYLYHIEDDVLIECIQNSFLEE